MSQPDAHARCHGIVLAAGAATRFDGVKLLSDFRGQPLITWPVRTALGSPVDGPNGLSRIVCQPMVFPSPAIAIANGSVPTTTSRCSGSYRREIVPSAKGAESSRASHRLFVPSLTHIADRRPAVHRRSSSKIVRASCRKRWCQYV